MPQVIHELLGKEPFEPFRILTTGGDSYDVTHAGLVVLGKTRLFYGFPKSDRFVFIPYRQIASIEGFGPSRGR